jgi:hypothetical protein
MEDRFTPASDFSFWSCALIPITVPVMSPKSTCAESPIRAALHEVNSSNTGRVQIDSIDSVDSYLTYCSAKQIASIL